ncbi:cyclin D2;1 [Actinidia rufa]|uniref:Cyclin D21 n=1 Tax=Actinidia rufa TaxID=165716 RepID=A0A7J0GHQ2_9ERIC|nr:cyclin D2;1 [Actinidia rufa]
MAPNFDCAASGLLCSEDNSSSIFCDEVDLGAIDEDFELSWNNRNYGNNNQNKSFDGSELLSDFPMQSDEYFALMLKKETEHLPAGDYLQRLRNGDLDLGARREAVDWIGKVVAHFNFGPLCKYLSISYLDRFLSVHELSGIVGWGFIAGIDFLEFRPSEVAAAAAAATAVSVAGEAQTVDIEDSISFLAKHVEKEKVVKCVEMIQESSLMNGSMKCLTASIPFLPQSPIGVLDAACLSYKTDETTVGSCANSTDHKSSSPNTKRRKLNRPNEVEEI